MNNLLIDEIFEDSLMLFRISFILLKIVYAPVDVTIVVDFTKLVIVVTSVEVVLTTSVDVIVVTSVDVEVTT